MSFTIMVNCEGDKRIHFWLLLAQFSGWSRGGLTDFF
uniref:Uncharacterized protein n=1 Tax=Anguilla anguilla TaxID=7936 RepID=A0A0E9RX46_ANGAN